MAKEAVKCGPAVPGQAFINYDAGSKQSEADGVIAFATDRQSLCFSVDGKDFYFPLHSLNEAQAADLVHGVVSGLLRGVLFKIDNGYIDDVVGDSGVIVLEPEVCNWLVLIIGKIGKQGYITSTVKPATRYTICITEAGQPIRADTEDLEDFFETFYGLHDLCLDDTLTPEPLAKPYAVLDGGFDDLWIRHGSDLDLDALIKSELPLYYDLKAGGRCISSIFATAHYCYAVEKGSKDQIVISWSNEWSDEWEPRQKSNFDDGLPSDGIMVIAKPGESLLLYFTSKVLEETRCLELAFSQDGQSISTKEILNSDGVA